jgi:hypothetical protein
VRLVAVGEAVAVGFGALRVLVSTAATGLFDGLSLLLSLELALLDIC